MLVKMMVASCLLSLCGALLAAAADDNTFKSTYAARDVAIDTNPRSAFWQGAVSVYANGDEHGRAIPGQPTRISSRWTKKYLYLLFECPYDELHLKPNPDAASETNGLWGWDVAELFIGWDFEHIRRYKEFEVSPQREWVDLDINLDDPNHTEVWKWNSGFQVDARIDAKAKVWYGAMRIPFSAIDTRPPEAGRTLRANLFRCAGPADHRQLIAWKAPMSDSFHTPEKFGLLMLVKE